MDTVDGESVEDADCMSQGDECMEDIPSEQSDHLSRIDFDKQLQATIVEGDIAKILQSCTHNQECYEAPIRKKGPSYVVKHALSGGNPNKTYSIVNTASVYG